MVKGSDVLKAPPKTGRGRRILKQRDFKVHENPKSCLFLRGQKTTPDVTGLLKDLYNIRKPLGIMLNRRRHDMHPMDDVTEVERLCAKRDTSLFCYGSTSKKRPFRLVIGRLYNHELLDSQEYRISNYMPRDQFHGTRAPQVGAKPVVIFQGASFDLCEELKQAKLLLLDVFRGPKAEKLSLMGIETAIVISALDKPAEGGVPKLLFRHFRLHFKQSGTKVPRVELQELGPRFEMSVDRTKNADPVRWKAALQVPKELKKRQEKSVHTNALGEKRGRLYMDQQNFSKIYTPHYHLKGAAKRRRKQEDANLTETAQDAAEFSA